MKIARGVGLIVLVFATAYALYRWTWMPMHCARETFRASRALDAAQHRGEFALRRAAGDARASLRGCESVATHETWFTLAATSDVLGDPRSAIDEYRRALDLDQRPETYFGLAMAAIGAGDKPLAIENFERACAFDPARLADIPYDEIRRETERRLR